ncbi:MAG TPA: carbonic anhydrase [Pseudobdellovibrionaceae bacterium]|nr:carbonic anhydrase [Pseudobdellovibrionaceae bacterium]
MPWFFLRRIQAPTTAPVPSEPLVTDTDFEITKASQRIPGKIKGDQALLWMKNGNKRFTTGRLRKDGQSKKDIKRLVASQQPHSVILSCSDSRTPPEVLFDQKLGEIYVVRTAGPSLDSAVIASLEDAVERLGVNLLIVMGHSSCETIKTALRARPAKSPHLAHLLAAMSLRLKAFSRRPASTELKEEAWTNVSGVTQELLEKSLLIRTALESGTLKIQEALYDMNQGSVEFKDH